MNDEHSFEQIREDVEVRQRATVSPDTLRNGSSVYEFLWKGDAKAKPVQRAGLIVFALFFLLMAIYIALSPFGKDFEDVYSLDFFMALLALLLSMRLLRNAFLGLSKRCGNNETTE
jgi:hypothetical protein